MRLTIVATAIAIATLSACTTTGAPPPGERISQQECEVGEMLVCSNKQGSRLESQSVTCTCSSADQIDQF